MRTQWRHGFNGPTGMVYSEIPQVMTLLEIEDEVESKAELFSALRVMEAAAMSQISKNQKAREKK